MVHASEAVDTHVQGLHSRKALLVHKLGMLQQSEDTWAERHREPDGGPSGGVLLAVGGNWAAVHTALHEAFLRHTVIWYSCLLYTRVELNLMLLVAQGVGTLPQQRDQPSSSIIHYSF